MKDDTVTSAEEAFALIEQLRQAIKNAKKKQTGSLAVVVPIRRDLL